MAVGVNYSRADSRRKKIPKRAIFIYSFVRPSAYPRVRLCIFLFSRIFFHFRSFFLFAIIEGLGIKTLVSLIHLQTRIFINMVSFRKLVDCRGVFRTGLPYLENVICQILVIRVGHHLVRRRDPDFILVIPFGKRNFVGRFDAYIDDRIAPLTISLGKSFYLNGNRSWSHVVPWVVDFSTFRDSIKNQFAKLILE